VRRALALGCLALAACSTDRVLVIKSDPPDARVWVDGVDKGKTPVEVPFVFYGWTHVRLEKEGFQALAAEVHVEPLIDGYPIVDLPFELTVRERRFEFTGRLEPEPELTPELTKDDIRRATELRERTRREGAATAGPGAAPATTPAAPPAAPAVETPAPRAPRASPPSPAPPAPTERPPAPARPGLPPPIVR
jgi:hypothetical protein